MDGLGGASPGAHYSATSKGWSIWLATLPGDSTAPSGRTTTLLAPRFLIFSGMKVDSFSDCHPGVRGRRVRTRPALSASCPHLLLLPFLLRIPLIADTHSRLIADSVPGDRGHPGWVSE